MNIALKRLAGAGFTALMLAGSAVSVSSPVLAAEGADYCKHHSCGPAHHHDAVRRDSYRHEGYRHDDGYRHEGYRHDGPGVAPLVGGIVGGILGGAAAAAGADCWREDEYGRSYNAC